MMRELAKRLAHCVATVVVTPMLVSFLLRSRLLGRDRALQGSTQMLAVVPGVVGQYLRRALLARVLPHCDRSATIEYGCLFSHADARVDARVYVGPYCTIGFVHLEADVLVASGVQILSGARTHGVEDRDRPIREQPGGRHLVRIGGGAWIGAGAIVMADVGAGSIIGAGAVVTRPIPAGMVAAGVPARVLRTR